MAAAGLPVNSDFVTSLGYDPQQGRAAMRAIGALAERPTALVVANVNAALGLLVEARTLGIGIPQDLSIVAIHDAWTAANAWPPLTTVRMPLYELGKVSMAAIFDRIRTQAIDDVVVRSPAPELVLRESTTPI
jgi:LacI family transcriptional regulator